MADFFRGRNHSARFVSDRVDMFRTSVDSCGSSSSADSSCSGSLDGCDKSRRSLRFSNNLLGERKAYPLPHPMQFEKLGAASMLSSDSTDDILHPMHTFMRCTEKEQQKPRGEDDSPNSPSTQRSMAAMQQSISRIRVTDTPPSASLHRCPEQPTIVERSAGNFAEAEDLGFVHHHHHHHGSAKKAENMVGGGPRIKAFRKVLVVYDGEKKFTTASLDIAINGCTTSGDDVIRVVAFLEHIPNPMGMKMVADMEQFSGVNDAVLKQAVFFKKMEIESKLQETSRFQECETKKIHLDVKVLPGSDSKVLVTKEALAFQATSVIFDKNAMKKRKYYQENLSCHILRLRSDGRRVETVALMDQGLDKTGSVASHCSDSSSGSVSSEPACNSSSIWSKLNTFVSKSGIGHLRQSHGGPCSSALSSSSTTSSESGSPRTVLQEEEEDDTALEEALEESFTFDIPKPDASEAFDNSFSFDILKPKPTHEAYVYAAAGLDDYSLYARRKNGGTCSTAWVA